MYSTKNPVEWWNEDDQIINLNGATFFALMIYISSTSMAANWITDDVLCGIYEKLGTDLPRIGWREMADTFSVDLVLNKSRPVKTPAQDTGSHSGSNFNEAKKRHLSKVK